jgi:hypothetical protein
MEEQEARKNCIMRSFIIPSFHHQLIRPLELLESKKNNHRTL